jgi:hypothetical protein
MRHQNLGNWNAELITYSQAENNQIEETDKTQSEENAVDPKWKSDNTKSTESRTEISISAVDNFWHQQDINKKWKTGQIELQRHQSKVKLAAMKSGLDSSCQMASIP